MFLLTNCTSVTYIAAKLKRISHISSRTTTLEFYDMIKYQVGRKYDNIVSKIKKSVDNFIGKYTLLNLLLSIGNANKFPRFPFLLDNGIVN